MQIGSSPNFNVPGYTLITPMNPAFSGKQIDSVRFAGGEDNESKQESNQDDKKPKTNWLSRLFHSLIDMLRGLFSFGKKSKDKIEETTTSGSKGSESTSEENATNEEAEIPVEDKFQSYPELTGNEPFAKSIAQLTKELIGKEWYPSPRALELLQRELNEYPDKDKIDLSNLNTEEGKAFFREAMEQIVSLRSDYDLCGLKPFSDEFNHVISEIADIRRETSAKTDPLTLLQEVHQHVFQTIKALATTENPDQIFETARRKGSEIRKRWTNWQQIGDDIWRSGKENAHKAIYQAWPIQMQELSNLHRDIEALCHLIEHIDKDNKEPRSKAIKALAQRIMNAGTLEKMCQAPQTLTRDDIPSDWREWYTQWRTIRNASGVSRDRHVLRELNETFKLNLHKSLLE